MAGVKGRSGTNKGKDKPWANALRLAVMAEDGGIKKLRRLAERCVAEALAGDMQAIKEIGDRLDGKPVQEATLTVDDKRDAADWTRDELVAVLNDARAGGERTAQADGRGDQSDSVH